MKHKNLPQWRSYKMKKLAALLLVLALSAFCTAEMFADCEFLGTTRDTSLEKEYKSLKVEISNEAAMEYIGEVRKLSKGQEKAIWDSLKKYDYKNGEIYKIFVAPDGHFYFFIVEVEWRNFKWRGCEVGMDWEEVFGSILDWFD